MVKPHYNLTHPQKRIWYSEKLHPGTGMWNNAGTMKIRGSVDYSLLEKAFCLFVKQNDAVRIRIGVQDGVPYQYITEYKPFSVEILDFSARGIEKLYEWDSAQTQAPMPLIDSNLLYFALYKINEDEGGFYVKFHHLISDGISLVAFGNQIIENYQCLLEGREPEQIKRSSYLDFIDEEQAYLSSERFSTDKAYWVQRFEHLPEPTVIKQRRTHHFSKKAERKAFVISTELSAQLREFCHANRLSVFTVFLSALAIYINRITNKHDIIIGTPVANRTTRRMRNAIGMFVSTVPVRIHTKDDFTFAEFANEVSRDWFSALKHQKYPYDVLMQDLRKINSGLESLYDVTLSYQTGTLEKANASFSYEGRWHFSGYQADSLCIHVNDREDEGRFIIDYDYHTPLFHGKEIEYIHQHLINILCDAMDHPEKELYLLSLMSEEEKDRIVCRFNDTARAFPQNQTLVDIWHRRMEKSAPDEIAVIDQGQYMTCRMLDEHSSKLACVLAESGIGPDSIVGLLVERTFDYCIYMLAILKAGGAFLPIDASLPKERIAYMIKDSGMSVLLTSTHLSARSPDLAGLRVIKGDACETQSGQTQAHALRHHHLAYVIYTSGSTGQPKGVQIEHRSIVQLVYSLNEICALPRNSRVLCAASISFDLSVMELVISLFGGNVVVLAPDHAANIPRNMVSLIKTAGVNAMIVTPGRMELLLSDHQGAECLANFSMIGLGGDVLSEKLLASVQECTKARIFNFYGPTEITICCTCADVTLAKVPNIGKPMPNVKAYILDAHLNAVPIGVSGELYIGGSGVSRGYIGKSDLNRERFVNNPFIQGQKIYRTGDLARWYPLGEIEFLGRIDKQVKIRGYRIELGEIESRIMQIEHVTACIVADREDTSGRKYLCAYLCGNPPGQAQIRAQLIRDLPAYMVPSYFIKIDSLPYSASGKVDRSLLPDPVKSGLISKDDFVPPRTPTEKALAGIWSRVLGTGDIGRDDSFFDIGGDSLSIVKVMAKVQQAFHVDILLEEVYHSPDLKAFAALIDAAEQSDYQPIVPVPQAGHYPVSSAQQRMWVLANGQDAMTAYNMPIVLHLSGRPDDKRLKIAFARLIQQHDALRTSFHLIDNELRQVVHKQVDFKVDHIQCGARECKEVIRTCIRPFQMDKAPLLRVSQIEAANGQWLLFIDMHHIISDWQTTERFMADLARFYAGDELSPKSLEYKDYACWQQAFLQSESINLQKDYWKSALSGELPLLNLHTDRPRGATQRFTGSRLRFDIGMRATEKLREFAAQHGGTLFMAFLAVYNVLLAKYTGQEDIIVGTPVSGRPREELQQIAGVFINTLPLRNYPKGEMSFAEFFDVLCQNTVLALANSDYPLDRIIADLDLPRDAARNPLFDTMLVLTRGDLEIKLGDIKVEHHPVDPGVAKLDLTLELHEWVGGLQCELEYNNKLFNKATIKRIAQHFLRLVELLAEEPDVRICDVAMLTQQDLWQLTQGFNQTDQPLETGKSIQSLLEDQARLQGSKTALIIGGEQYSFNELNRRANRIAVTLRENGVGRNTIVALCLRRSFDLIAAIFGVLKAGGGYLPIDTSYPPERVSFMLSDSGAKILLTDGSAEYSYNGTSLHVQDIPGGDNQNIEHIDIPGDIAYVIYTSGSTGMPKGSALPRRGLMNLFESAKTSIAYEKSHTSVSVTTVSFDIFIGDAILPLLFGCSVALCTEEELRQPHLLAKVIEETKAKFIQTTPTRMRGMLSDQAFRSAMAAHIRKIVLGGEMVPVSLLKLIRRYTNAPIINGYGPTEATVYASFKNLTNTFHVTIGRPISNTRFYILDQYKRPVAVGVQGEAYISGAGVSFGYINREELNRKAFLPDPYWPGHVMYKTGDICAFLPGGEIEIFGRIDHQVKLRGLRIELGEIEAALHGMKGIEAAVVKDWGAGTEKYLCAYYQAERNIDAEEIREHLRQKLPVHMIPVIYMRLETLPTTLNGKVNRKALIEPDRHEIRNDSKKQKKKMTDTEKRMAKVWSKVLKVNNIDVDDSFFALGGDSLGVIKVQAATVQYGWSLRTQDFYDYQTLAKICAGINRQKVKESGGEKQKAIPVPEFEQVTKIKLRNIMLTGATGYLGAFLLAALADMPETRVFCLVRGTSPKDCTTRLANVLTFYFGMDICARILGKVIVIQGDIGLDWLGIDTDTLDKLHVIDTVIHSAALTDHIGHVEAFARANVRGTRNVADFARSMQASLLHISTTSVSGRCFMDDPDREGVFSEKSFYIGQNTEENEYVKSKFQAERIVYDSMRNGLNARVFRIGLLTSSVSGVFQMHPEKNAFANRLKALCELGCVPRSMLSHKIEMTPVDCCAEAILGLARMETKQTAYHVQNPHTVSLGQIIAILEQSGCRIRVLSDNSFLKKVNQASKQGNDTIITGVAGVKSAFLGSEKIKVTADTTLGLLSGSGFSWPFIDEAYIRDFLMCINK